MKYNHEEKGVNRGKRSDAQDEAYYKEHTLVSQGLT